MSVPQYTQIRHVMTSLSNPTPECVGSAVRSHESVCKQLRQKVI